MYVMTSLNSVSDVGVALFTQLPPGSSASINVGQDYAEDKSSESRDSEKSAADVNIRSMPTEKPPATAPDSAGKHSFFLRGNY